MVGVTSLVWQIRFEGASVNVSGILHCTALWKDFKLLYSLQPSLLYQSLGLFLFFIGCY